MAATPPGSPAERARLVVPEFGLDVPLAVAVWLVPQGSAVIEGDRVVQLVAGGVTIDLEAPVTGRLAACLVEEDEPVATGTVLAEFVAEPEMRGGS
ncbi:MAG: lipoyl domain-containing protein [Planctomycetaceae bacterium]|jgi:pyruvate/2-oxoglutarate dehydrogenase complex dihydrolipoamide acyltransferase (E2) component|nr:lipoyl domain-containing protein [Planctomycetaceae bacterium]